MNFAEFQSFRQSILRDRPDVRDAGETNLYAALARLIPPPTPAPETTVHRCHLASEWCEFFGLHESFSKLVLVSRGVRDSLARLFAHYASVNARVWLPEDNYPVYAELARAAGVEPRFFPTLPTPVWPSDVPTGGPEFLLITNPLKPLGRWLSVHEYKALSKWLDAGEQRRVLIDAVYTFGKRLHPLTVGLFDSGQAIELHSLTKGWLQPRMFGVTVIPSLDREALEPLFRADPPPQLNLARAREMMAQHAQLPSQIAEELDGARARMHSAFAVDGLSPLPVDAPGYFTPVQMPWRDLLETHKILGLPASAFGSTRDDLTILSSLPFLS